MGWLDIRNRIEVPIMTDEGIEKIIDSYLETSNYEMSRVITLDSYRKPASRNFSNYSEFNNYVFLKIIEVIKLSFSTIIKNNDLRNKGEFKDTPMEELSTLSTLSNEDYIRIINLLKNGEETKISNDYNLSIETINSLSEIFDNLDINKGFFATSGNVIHGGVCYKKNEKSTIRIYMNRDMFNKESWEFIISYMKFCVENGVALRLKPAGGDKSVIDNIIIYSTDSDLDIIIDFIQKYIKNHPDVMNSYGSPIATGGNVVQDDGKAYYAITRVKGYGATYNSYFNSMSKAAFANSCYPIVKKYAPDSSSVLNKMIMNKNSKSALDNIVFDDKLIKVMNEIIKKYPMVKKELMIKYRENLKRINSFITFGDLDHTEVPIFLSKELYERSTKPIKYEKKDEIVNETREIYAQLKLIEKYFMDIHDEINQLPQQKKMIIAKYYKKITSPSDLGEDEIQEIRESGLIYDLWKFSRLIISIVGDSANDDFNELKNTSSEIKR